MWINAETKVIYKYIYEIRQAFPEISLPEFPTNADFETFNVYSVVETAPPEYDVITQDLFQTVEYIDGCWIQVWRVEAATIEEITKREEVSKQKNKAQAMQLLTETDWTQMPDVYLVNKNDFTTYRHDLRQIALNPPVEVTEWPIKPTEVWSE